MDIQSLVESITESIEGSDKSSNEVFGAAIRELVVNGVPAETIGEIAIKVDALVLYVNKWREKNGLPLV
jgi:hypothetical protein